jgi:arylsulfatase A-like enzyme
VHHVAGVAALVVLAIVVLAGCHHSERAVVPDVVLVVADALRADRVQYALDGDSDRLPNLVHLARDGVVYERAASPGTWCVPAFASLLTGRWPSFHGAERRRLGGELVVQPIAAEATTLAEILRQRGFHTAAFLPGRDDLSTALGFERGFTDWVNDATLASPAALTDAVGHWLEGQRGPVFLVVSLDELRDSVLTDAGGLARSRPRADITNVAARTGELPAAERDRLIAEYDAALPDVDHAIGDLLGLLQSAGRYAGALVIVTSDHGELLGEHGLAGHGWPPFEDALDVPLVVKYPGGRDAGTRVERRVSSVGVFATALDEVGAPLPADIQAKPLADHHPVWTEDVDRRGRRVRAGYDGLREKIIRVDDGVIDAACTYDMYTDRAEMRPDCSDTSDSALRRAMASFGRRARPGEATSGLAQVGEAGAGARTKN